MEGRCGCVYIIIPVLRFSTEEKNLPGIFNISVSKLLEEKMALYSKNGFNEWRIDFDFMYACVCTHKHTGHSGSPWLPF